MLPKFNQRGLAYLLIIFLFFVCFVLTFDSAFLAEKATPKPVQPPEVVQRCTKEKEACGTIAGIECYPGLEYKMEGNYPDVIRTRPSATTQKSYPKEDSYA